MAIRGIDPLNSPITIRNCVVNILRHYDCCVPILRITPWLNVPILNRANDMSLISFAELNFDLIPTVGITLLRQKIKPSRSGLRLFSVLKDHWK